MFFKNLFLCIYIYICFTTLLIEAQGSCKPYIGDPDGLLLCHDRLINPNSIYTTNSSSQIMAQEVIKSLLFQISTSDICNIEPVRIGICSLNLPNCIAPAFPSLVCRSECEALKELCPLFDTKINCSSPLFPIGDTVYNISGNLITIPCSKPSSIKGSSYNQQICPTPLLVKNKTDPEYYPKEGYNYVAESSCVLPCPINFYSDKQWDSLYMASKVISSFSFIVTFFTSVTYGILNRKHNLHTVGVAFFAFNVLIVNLTDLITAGHGYRETLCPKPGKLAVQSDAICGATGALLHFGLCSVIIWWTTIGIDLLCRIKRWKPKFLKPLYVVTCNISAGLIFMIVPLAKNNIKAGNGVLGCWVVDDQNGYFFIPFLIIISVGVFCILWVMKEIYVIVKEVHSDTRFIKLQIKPILFILFVFGSFFYIFCAHFYIDSKKSKYLQGTSNYVLCISQPFLTDETRALCGKPQGPTYGVIFMFYFFIRFFGIFLFIFYGLTRKAAQIWVSSFILKSKITTSFLSKLNITIDGVNSNTGKNSSSKANSQLEKNHSQKNSIELDGIESRISSTESLDI